MSHTLRRTRRQMAWVMAFLGGSNMSGEQREALAVALDQSYAHIDELSVTNTVVEQHCAVWVQRAR